LTTIRRRLLVWLLTGLCATAGLGGLLSYFAAHEEVDELLDYQLKGVALSLRHPDLVPQVTAVENIVEEEDQLVVQVWDRSRTSTYVSEGGSPMPRLDRPGFSNFPWKGSVWRGYLLQDDEGAIQVAQSLSSRTEMSAKFALRNILALLLLIPVLGVVIWIAVGKGLKPLKEATRSVADRTPEALSPVHIDNLPEEVRPLIESLNNLLQRLDVALTTQRQFVADAAHELRTPLTALRLQADILERTQEANERRSAVTQLQQGFTRMSHLVQQLLTLARLEPGHQTSEKRLIDVTALAKKVLADYSALARAMGVDLGLERDGSASVIGNGDSLYSALANLVDNAIRYTPTGGRVDVSVGREDRDVVIEIVDTGIGIPADSRARVFDRFYRLPGNDASGSGLGLAIVKNAIDQHAGLVRLLEGPSGRGLWVIIRLPGA
jgi:two-component system, OmpR family, sensor kinase